MESGSHVAAQPGENLPMEEKLKESKAWSFSKELVDKTTFHGISYVFQGGNKMRRFIWFVMFFTCAAYFLYTTFRLYDYYRSYPVTTKNKIVNNESMVFPAVSICNYNDLRASKFDRGTPYQNELDEWPVDKVFTKYGHTMDEDGMLVHCEWMGDKCNSSFFLPSVQSLGLCHTFNSGQPNYTLQHVRAPGESNGLQLTLNVQVYDYRSVATAIGLKIRVHDQLDPILITDHGFGVMPGRKALVSIKKKQIINLPDNPDTECEEASDGFKYSKSSCLDECKTNYLIEKCGCQSAPPQRSDVKLCRWREYQNCYKGFEAEFRREGRKNCSCVKTCSRTLYEADLSYALFNIISDTPSLRDAVTNSSASRDDFLRENVLQLSIFFDELSYEQNEDVAAYLFRSFLAEAGGTMGLFLGASMLTIAEVFDLICRVIFFYFSKK